MNHTIDSAVLDFFHHDEFLDETIAIIDFEGNIISTIRDFHINFFGEFSTISNLSDIIDQSYYWKFYSRLQELKNGNHVPPTEYKLTSSNNKSAFVFIFSKTIDYPDHKAILVLLRDITLYKEMENSMLYTIVQTEEKERQRFSRDLHDELGPFLSGLNLYLNELRDQSILAEKRNSIIDYLTQMTTEAVEKVRSIASNLTPQNMIDVGLTESVNRMICRLNQTGRFMINLHTQGSDTGLEPSFIITLYRIILELLNNSIKHSECKKIQILLSFRKKITKLRYVEDGKGFNFQRELIDNNGIGLKSIISRISLYQGNYKFKRLQPQGYAIEMFFPLKIYHSKDPGN